MFSIRFNRPIILTRHASLRMAEREIDEVTLIDIIDNGQVRMKDEQHLWAFKHFDHRSDNLICAVLVLETVVVVKTVMHEFNLKD